MERFWLFEPHTGTRLQEVFPLSGNSEASCKSVGSATYQFHLGASGLNLSFEEARSAFRSVAHGIVQGTEDGGVTWAGPIWSRSWDETTEVLTVRCREIRAVLAKRFWYYIGEYGTEASTINLAGSLAQIIAHLLDFAFVRSRVRWDIPLDRTTPAPGGTSHARTYERTKTTTIDRAISELENMENGPDLYLEPAWGSDFSVKWIRRLGTPRLPGGVYDFDMDAPESPIISAGFEDDADNFTTGLLVTGDGMSDSRIIAQVVEADIPGKYGDYGGLFLDDQVSGDWDTAEKAFAHGKAILTANSAPMEDMPLVVLDDHSPGAAKWWPGARVTARKDSSRFLPKQQRYVTGVKRRVGSPLVSLESVEV